MYMIRHVGDLGNIKEDASGNVVTQKIDSVIKFDGTNDITGRAIVVCTRTLCTLSSKYDVMYMYASVTCKSVYYHPAIQRSE